MSGIAVSEYRRRRKINLIKVCGSKCNLCGYDKAISALEFHHLNQTEKDYGIASNGTCHDLEKDLTETKKCILVCANCHREIHEDLYPLSFLEEKQIYDEEYANQLRQEKQDLIGKKTYFCKECGKEITRYSESGLCPDCVKSKTRVVNRPSREELKQMIRTMPFTQIGVIYGVSDNAVRKWCKTYQLPQKKTEINQFTNEDWLEV